jgi:glycosyltransferase 2 family protein
VTEARGPEAAAVVETRTALGVVRPSRPLIWVGLGVTVAFGYFAVRDVQLSEMWDALKASNYMWLLPALLTLAVAIFLRGLRWRALFADETRPPVRAISRALLVGYFFNSVLPLRAGEAARVIALYRAAGNSRAETSGTVLIERVYDVASLVALLFLVLVWLPGLTWITDAVVLAVALAGALVAAVVLLALRRDQLIALGVRIVHRVPFLPHELADRAVRNLAHGLAGLTRARVAVAAIAWTFASWVVMACSFWMVTLCFGFDVPVLAGLLVVIATSLSLVLPSSPGAIGVFEAAAIIALDAYGIPRAEALSYAIVLHGLNFFPFVVAGGVVLWPSVRGRARRRLT